MFIKSLFTDLEWDGDLTKVIGFILCIVAVVGFFMQLPEWQWMMGFGSGLIATGKFSKQG